MVSIAPQHFFFLGLLLPAMPDSSFRKSHSLWLFPSGGVVAACVSEIHRVSSESPTMWVPPQIPNPQQCFNHPSVPTPFFTSLLPSCNALCMSLEKIVLSAAHWLILKKISYLSKRFHANLWGKNAKSSFAPWFMPLVSDYCCSVVWTLHIVFSSPCSMIFRESELSVLTGSSQCRENLFRSAGHCCHQSCWKKQSLHTGEVPWCLPWSCPCAQSVHIPSDL